jgi:hypothetical protein
LYRSLIVLPQVEGGELFYCLAIGSQTSKSFGMNSVGEGTSSGTQLQPESGRLLESLHVNLPRKRP